MILDAEINKHPANRVFPTAPQSRHSKSMEHLIQNTKTDSTDLSLSQSSYPPNNYCRRRLCTSDYTCHRSSLDNELYAPVVNISMVCQYSSLRDRISTLPLPATRSSRSRQRLDILLFFYSHQTKGYIKLSNLIFLFMLLNIIH